MQLRVGRLRPDWHDAGMKRRAQLFALAVLAPVLATGACGGPSVADGTATAKQVRASTARTYWKIRNSLPGPLDVAHGQGAFQKCRKTAGAVAYNIEDYLYPLQSKTTMKQLLAEVKTTVAPQGWKLAPLALPPDTQADPVNEKLHAWIAHQNGLTIQLTLHERAGKEPAGGYLGVFGACKKYGRAQKGLLAKYADGRDTYKPSKTSRDPIPTGFPSYPA